VNKVIFAAEGVWEEDEARIIVPTNTFEPQDDQRSGTTQLSRQRRPRYLTISCDSDMQKSFAEAEKRLGTKALVCLALMRSGPARAIENELLKGSLPVMLVKPPSGGISMFIVNTESAIGLLGTHCDAGGRFVADQLAKRIDLGEQWTMIVTPERMNASAYQGARRTFFTTSDYPGVETQADAFPEKVETPECRRP
jgi:hypothetical protein